MLRYIIYTSNKHIDTTPKFVLFVKKIFPIVHTLQLLQLFKFSGITNSILYKIFLLLFSKTCFNASIHNLFLTTGFVFC